MKNLYKLLIIIGIILLSFIAANFLNGSRKPDALYQISTLQALIQGGYDGETTISDLVKHGDYGLGTFDGLDGEMIVLDGKVYKGKVDGKIYAVKQNEITPFANVAFIKTNKEKIVSFAGGYKNLKNQLNHLYQTGNIPIVFYAKGDFKNLTYRSVPKQKKPYFALTEVVKEQAIFKKENISGFIIGFYFPPYMKDINANGYHLHFISSDKKYGGHLLNVEAGNIKVKAQKLDCFSVLLPNNIEGINLKKSKSQDVATVEK